MYVTFNILVDFAEKSRTVVVSRGEFRCFEVDLSLSFIHVSCRNLAHNNLKRILSDDKNYGGNFLNLDTLNTL
jgi:hypothetical protein